MKPRRRGWRLSANGWQADDFAFNMKNRFREFFADKVDVAHTAQEEPKNAS